MSDYVLFKFQEINKYLIDGLVKGSIYFASPEKLNDPFDCRVDIKKAAGQAIEQLSGRKKEILTNFLAEMEHYLDRIQTDTNNMAVCSFSLSLYNPLLWVHYANQHKGVCLTYEFTESFLNNPKSILGVAPVVYEDNSMTNWFVENTITENTNFEEYTKEILKKVLTIKGPDWSYEEEVRLIREQDGLYIVGKDKLKQICFGLDTTEQDISLIRGLIDNAGYSVKFCKVERSQNDFGIEAKEI